jgi:hypothetical protein
MRTHARATGEWRVADDAAQSIFCWLRRDGAGREVPVLSSFGSMPRPAMRLLVPA